jgi:two-component system, NarL family, sensor kinase
MSRGSQRARVLRFGTRRDLAVFVGGGVLMTLVVGLGAGWVCHSVAHEQALEDSARVTQRMSEQVVAPLVSGYLAKNPDDTAELKRVIGSRMRERNLTEVTIWGADGEVLYSDKPGDIGKKLPLSEDLLAALAGTTTSAWEDDEPEADATSVGDALASTADDTGDRRYVEVYAPLRVAGEPPLAFEAYFDYRQVDDLAGKLLRQILPLVLIPLVLLQLLQIPVGLSLGRRLRRSEEERLRLVQRALADAEQQRVRFAADLHDGPIHELAGTSYALGAVASTVPGPPNPLVGRLQDALLRSIQSLRGLMTDLDPPDLRSGRLDRTVATLAEQLRDEGVDVELELAELPELSGEVMAVVYQVVREALAQAQDTAAGRVLIRLAPVAGLGSGADAVVRLVITDDGVGLDASRVDRRSERYQRGRLLHDRAASMGGKLLVTSAAGDGTTVELELPARATGN